MTLPMMVRVICMDATFEGSMSTVLAKKAATRGSVANRRQPVHVGPPKPATLDSIKEWFQGDALVAALKRDDRVQAMVSTLSAYAEHDAYSTLNMIKAGEIYYNFLLQPLDVQRAFTTKMAELNGTEVPEYAVERKQGRGESGRNQLAQAIYGKHPEMFEIQPGSRDTRAGKRVSACLRAYKIQAGLIKPRVPSQVAAIPKTGAQMFVTLLGVATDDEAQLLDELAQRAGIDAVTIARWHRNLEQAAATQPEAEGQEVAA